jgi:hypothetical protein
MPLTDDGFVNKTKHVSLFGQNKISSEITAVIVGPFVYLDQKAFTCSRLFVS